MLTVKVRLESSLAGKIKERFGNSLEVRTEVGYVDGSVDKNGVPNALKAFYNEFGTKKIPARPFMRNTVARCKDDWARDIKGLLRAGYTPREAMEAIGSTAEADIKQTIEQGVPPPNKPETTARKAAGREGGADAVKTLIDTGAMYEGISHRVVEK